jgi:hypothetical protein
MLVQRRNFHCLPGSNLWRRASGGPFRPFSRFLTSDNWALPIVKAVFGKASAAVPNGRNSTALRENVILSTGAPYRARLNAL